MVIADDPDLLVDRFVCYAESNGCSVERLSYANACRRLSISRAGSSVRVEPVVPMLLRLPSSNPWADDESQFHRAERCSLVWAAAALSSSPAINRPDAFGFSSQFALSTAVVKSRAGLRVDAPESYSSEVPEPLGPSSEWWLERQEDRRTIAWSMREDAAGPFRAARVRPGFVLRTYTVVGDRSFVDIPGTSDVEIGQSSIELCKGLGVAFATVTWRWYASEQTAEFARLNPHPTIGDVGAAWAGVAPKLLSELLQ